MKERLEEIGYIAAKDYFIQISTDIMTPDTRDCFLKIKKYIVQYFE